MGEAFLSAKKERFDHDRDNAVRKEFKAGNLLSLLPDILTDEYRCRLTSPEYKPTVGDRVVVASLNSARVEVLHRNVIIGHVLTHDAAKLRQLLTTSTFMMLAAEVRSIGKLTPTFVIAVEIPVE